MNIKKQVFKLFTLDFLGSFNLTDSIWLLLLVSRGFSLWEAGLAEGVFHLVSLLCEIPSGMFADLYGRRKALCASWLVWGAASVLMLLSTNIWGVCLAFGLNALGYNLSSGTREALTYDSLKQAGQEERYISVSSWQNVIWRGARAAVSLLAGVALLMGYRVCYYLHIGVCLLGATLTLTLTEAENGQPRGIEKISPGRVASDLVRQAREAMDFLWGAPTARTYMLAAACTTGTVAMVGFFLQQRLNELGAGGAVTLGPLLFLLSLGGVAGARLAVRFYRLRYRRVFLLCVACISACMLFCGVPVTPLCVAGGFALFLFDEVLCTVTEVKLNELFPSEQRATLVSVFSMCISLSMVVLSPMLGVLCSLLGLGRAFAVMAAFPLCILLLVHGNQF